MYGASKVQKSKNRFVRADVLFAELASDFGGELVVGGGPFREPPTVMQSTVMSEREVREGPINRRSQTRPCCNEFCAPTFCAMLETALSE